MKKNKEIIGVIGYGNMGSAIVKKIKQEYQVFVFDKDSTKSENTLSIKITDTIQELVTAVKVVILAVKPQDFDTVLADIKYYTANKLIVSIAAGIPTDYIEKKLGNVDVIRVMPNLPAKIGKGITSLCKGKFATEDDLHFAQELFNHIGQTLILEENMMDAATAVAGSGPGFLYALLSGKEKEKWEEYTRDVFMPDCEASAQTLGFSQEQARLLAQLVAQGSISLLKELKESPEALCKQVTSKGGTTEAGLEILRNNGSLKDAMKAANKRAKELSK